MCKRSLTIGYGSVFIIIQASKQADKEIDEQTNQQMNKQTIFKLCEQSDSFFKPEKRNTGS